MNERGNLGNKMRKLLIIEVKRFSKNLITLLTFGLILAMYITQCLPKKWYWYSGPMDEMHFMYTIMLEDYSRGHTEELKTENQILTQKIYFNDESKNLLINTIKYMNPDYTKNTVIRNISFCLTNEEFDKIMNELDKVVGGGSYYATTMRTIYYNQYISNAFHIDTSLNTIDTISAMKQYLRYTVNEKSFTKYSELITKKVQITDNQLLYLKNIYEQMVSKDKQEQNVKELYGIYDNWFNEIDDMLGGNTAFGNKNRQYVLNLSNSLEDEEKNFESIKNEEKITNAYARYYSDYMVLLAGILPAVFGAFTLIEDRKYKLHELIYAKPMKSYKYVLSKFLAITLLFAIFFYLIAAISTILFYLFSQSYVFNVDNLAFFKYTTFWIMPTVLFTTAISMLLSIIINNGIVSIVIQLVIFFMSAQPLIGGYKWYRPIIRYNEIGNIDFYRKNFGCIMINRIGISIFSIVIVLITIKIYDNIRKQGVLFDSFVNLLHYIRKGGKKLD